jgi:MFS family permease
MRWYFGFFFVSGFCSILYELVWLRLAMAQFAVTTALVSIVLSAFMIGLGFGSWGAGRYVRSRKVPLSFPALRLYALTELLIGLSAILVPYELVGGRILLEKLGAGTQLPLDWTYAGAVVRVHGRDISLRYGCYPGKVSGRVHPLLQLPVLGKCFGRRYGRCHPPVVD